VVLIKCYTVSPLLYTPNLSPVPVPAALPLMASALGLFGIAAKRRKQKA